MYLKQYDSLTDLLRLVLYLSVNMLTKKPALMKTVEICFACCKKEEGLMAGTEVAGVEVQVALLIRCRDTERSEAFVVSVGFSRANGCHIS